MITPELKDNILGVFVSNPYMTFCNNEMIEAPKYGILPQQYKAIMGQFASMGFIVKKDEYDDIYVTINAHDFLARGGFTGQEKILKINIEKLGLEIDKLSKDLSEKQLDTANKIASLGQSILSFLGFMG